MFNKLQQIDNELMEFEKEFDIQFRSDIPDIKHVEQMMETYPDFTKKVFFPDGTIQESEKWKEEIIKYMERKTDDLELTLAAKLDKIKEIVELHLIPLVESA